MELKLVSPHRDDAAFSCGIFLSLCADSNIKVQVVNAFTHSNYAPFAEPSTADRISELRKNEDVALRNLLGDSLCLLDLGLRDAPLRLRIPAEQTLGDPLDSLAYAREVEDLQRVFRPILAGADCVLLPMALGGHIDHRIARDATMGCVPIETLAFYEDLPYAASMSEEQRESMLADFRFMATLQPIAVRRSNGAAVKRAVAFCYDSQVAASTVEEMACYAENRTGGETLYAGKDAARLLTSIVPLGHVGPVNS